MNKIYFLLIVLVVGFSTANAAEMWEIGSPSRADIGQRLSAGHDRLQLHVPKSFEGRTASCPVFSTSLKTTASATGSSQPNTNTSFKKKRIRRLRRYSQIFKRAEQAVECLV